LGFKISIDDFGTGYSSLSYLKRLPFDEIKIDRAFIKDMGVGQEDDIVIVKLMIQIAKTLGKEIVAEGAEDATQISILEALGCDYVQGYYYAKPMPIDELETFAKEHGEHQRKKGGANGTEKV
jgi:EAL domain-containing protein (putative c-di-GMP-specific phosphodiesterase class I)